MSVMSRLLTILSYLWYLIMRVEPISINFHYSYQGPSAFLLIFIMKRTFHHKVIPSGNIGPCTACKQGKRSSASQLKYLWWGTICIHLLYRNLLGPTSDSLCSRAELVGTYRSCTQPAYGEGFSWLREQLKNQINIQRLREVFSQ